MAKGVIHDFRPESARGYRRGDGLFLAGQLATLALLLALAHRYAFLTDDSFIAFRIARNVAEGDGLVFNPGMPLTTGIPSFLWVMILSAVASLGASPDLVSHVLTIGATLVWWWLVAEFASRDAPEGRRRWVALVPLLWLACTRSAAVWTSGGLDTRLFELLVLGGVIRLASELREILRRRPARWPASALLFVLAAMTRPEGILAYVAATAAALVTLRVRGRLEMRSFLRGPVFFAVVAAVYFVLRRALVGAWFATGPITGEPAAGPSAGWAQLAAWALEYGVWLWIPLIVLGVRSYVRRGYGWVPALFGAVLVPHALLLAMRGGDPFEFRAQDLWFPFAFLVMFEGLKSFPRGGRGTAGIVAATVAVLAGLVVIPFASHREFPDRWIADFPGQAMDTPEGQAFLDPARDPVLGLPGVRIVAGAHRDLLRRITSAGVGLRQEEHRLFLEERMAEASRLLALVHDDRVSPDAVIETGHPGAIGYVTDLQVVAPASGSTAPEADLLAFDPVRILFRADDPALRERLDEALRRQVPVRVADAGDGWVLLGVFPAGDRAEERFPGLDLVTPQEWEGSRGGR